MIFPNVLKSPLCFLHPKQLTQMSFNLFTCWFSLTRGKTVWFPTSRAKSRDRCIQLAVHLCVRGNTCMSPRRGIASKCSTAGSITILDVFILYCLVLKILPQQNREQKQRKTKTKNKNKKYTKWTKKIILMFVLLYFIGNSVTSSGAC